MIHFEELIYVSINMRAKIVEQHHNFRIYEHPEVSKIMKHIRRNYYFPRMKKLIKKHIAVCIECNQNKHFRHKSYENMRTSTISDRAWKFIALNFIMKLSKFKKFMIEACYDAVLIITDKLTKYCYFIAYNEAFTAKNLTYMFLKMIVSQHGISKKIISNRNKLFKSKF